MLKMISELNKYHGLPNGMFSCDEHLAGPNPSQGSELCTVVEYMFSLEQSLAITGDPVAAATGWSSWRSTRCPGRSPTICGPTSTTRNRTRWSAACIASHGRPTDRNRTSMGLEPNFGCCTANFHQGWPKFTNSLFLLSGEQGSDASDGLVAAAYAPCEVRTMLRGTVVHVVEETGYPFRGNVRFTVNPGSALSFPLQLRIPAWAAGAAIAVNGRAVATARTRFLCADRRTWNRGDRVEIAFPMKPRVSKWLNDSIAIERGPLVFSYGIGESWVKLRDRGMTADWQVFPTNQWNYALSVDADAPAKSIVVKETEVGDGPFTRRHAPCSLA